VIETLVQVARPQRVLYIAIDGVAPRAKMNNQRERRYKFVDEVRLFKEKASHTGQAIPESFFDPNSISPGTLFMLELNTQLEAFIVGKMETDPNWRQLEVVLSGVDVPGEGEHKMMQYMRERQGENTRHCLYGLDADLIVLGLATHQENVVILREEVNITYIRENPPRKLIGTPAKYQLICLNLVREYLQLDFACLPALDLERLIGDFILIIAFVGNDFIPRLPTFEISEGSINFLIETYKKLWSEVGYLSQEGVVQWPALARFLGGLPHYELKALEERVSSKKRVRTNEPMPSTATQKLSVKNLYFEGVNETYVKSKSQKKETEDPADDPEIPPEAPSIDPRLQETLKGTLKSGGIQLIKTRYYQEYFGFDVTQEPGLFQVRDVIREYLRGLQWVLFYYYRGCPDWEWFYRYHYGPMISDFQEVSELMAVPLASEMSFTLHTPYTPLHQLLTVLPPGSSHLLPASYRAILHSPDHLDMFPERPKIEYDFLCARVGWQSLKIILPFVRLEKVQELTADIEVTEEISRRNALGSERAFTYAPNSPARSVNICDFHVVGKEVSTRVGKRDLPLPVLGGFKARRQGNGPHPDFPSLTRLQFHPVLKEIGVQIFLSRSSLATLAFEMPCESRSLESFSQ